MKYQHKQIEVHKKILNNFGEVNQARKAAEEMAELSGKLLAWAYCKERIEKGEETEADYSRLQEKKCEIEQDELPDVLNIIEQLKLIFDEKDVESNREYKIRRTLKLYKIC